MLLREKTRFAEKSKVGKKGHLKRKRLHAGERTHIHWQVRIQADQRSYGLCKEGKIIAFKMWWQLRIYASARYRWCSMQQQGSITCKAKP